MGTVEEERDLVVADLAAYYKTAAVNLGERAESEAIDMVGALIAAVEARGVARGRAEGAAQQKAEIRRCARLTDGGGYVPSGYQKGAYIVPAFALDPETAE